MNAQAPKPESASCRADTNCDLLPTVTCAVSQVFPLEPIGGAGSGAVLMLVALNERPMCSQPRAIVGRFLPIAPIAFSALRSRIRIALLILSVRAANIF